MWTHCMYWVKCKQSNSHKSLTTLCSHLLLSYDNQAMTKSAHWWSWSCDLHGNLEEFFLTKILQKAEQRPTKVNFFPYKQVSRRYCDHQWLRMTNTFILYDLLWNVQKCHAANREGSFKYTLNTQYRHIHWLYVSVNVILSSVDLYIVS